jgi:hypothetical protein
MVFQSVSLLCNCHPIFNIPSSLHRLLLNHTNSVPCVHVVPTVFVLIRRSSRMDSEEHIFRFFNTQNNLGILLNTSNIPNTPNTVLSQSKQCQFWHSSQYIQLNIIFKHLINFLYNINALQPNSSCSTINTWARAHPVRFRTEIEHSYLCLISNLESDPSCSFS